MTPRRRPVDHGPLPTSMVRAHAFDEAGWAVRTLADNASSVGRWPIARAMAVAVVLLLGLPVLQLFQIDIGALVPLSLLGVLFALGIAFVIQASRGAEPVFRRLRLDRRRLVVDEIRGDWTLDEDEVLSTPGLAPREMAYDEIVGVAVIDERLTIQRRDAEPWTIDWLHPAMAQEVHDHLQRTLSDREDEDVVASRRAALQRLVAERPAE